MGLIRTFKDARTTIAVTAKDMVVESAKAIVSPVKKLSEESNFFGGIMEYLPTEKIQDQWSAVGAKFSEVFNKVFEEDDLNLDPQDVACAYIADRVYLNPFERPRHIFGYELDEKFNEFEYALYVSAEKKTWILGYRGTEVTAIKDYISDLNVLLGTQSWNTRFGLSIKVYEDAQLAYPDYHRWITGHSLGGTIAYFIAKRFQPDRCVVFNAGSSANPTFAALIADTQLQSDWTRRVFTYRISGDPISTLSVIGYTRTFRKRNLNPMGLHTISNFCTIPNTKKDVF